MAYETIIYEKKNRVATITQNRPEALNALSFKMSDELIDAFQQANDDDDVYVIVLTGTGRAFNVGADQKEAARVIREKEWHPTQRLEQKGKKTILHMDVQGLPEVARWVLYHSPNARVLSPPSLKEMVAQFASKTANRHEKKIPR